MERSREVADALVRFYEAFGVAEAFDSVVSADPDAMVIGTDRRVDNRDAWKAAFGSMAGITVEAVRSGASAMRVSAGSSTTRPSCCGWPQPAHAADGCRTRGSRRLEARAVAHFCRGA